SRSRGRLMPSSVSRLPTSPGRSSFVETDMAFSDSRATQVSWRTTQPGSFNRPEPRARQIIFCSQAAAIGEWRRSERTRIQIELVACHEQRHEKDRRAQRDKLPETFGPN